jgi:SAM-dependent methyltransferase
MDREPYPNVDVVGDAQELPFRSGIFDFVCCSSTLEHLHCPDRVIDEIRRVLRPGGQVFVETPFVYPFHGDDATGEKDYRRMTAAGLRHSLRDFRELETGQSVGPAGTVSLLLAEFLALFAASRRHTAFYYGVRNLVGWALVPLRYLDPWLARKNFSYRIAGGFYFLGRKDGPPTAEGYDRG